MGKLVNGGDVLVVGLHGVLQGEISPAWEHVKAIETLDFG